MKKMFLIISIILFISISCSTTNSIVSPTNNTDNTIPLWATELMQKIPFDVELVIFNNIVELRSDSDLNTPFEYTAWDFHELGIPDKIVSIDNVQYWVQYDTCNLLIGDFNYIAVRKFLRNKDWYTEEYYDFEIWSNTDYNANVTAFNDDILVFGDETLVINTINTICDESPSLNDNEQFMDLMLRLPSGFLYGYREAIEELITGTSETIIIGTVTAKATNDIVHVTSIATSNNPNIAKRYMQELAEMLGQTKEINRSDINVIREGDFTTLSVDVLIGDYQLF